MGMRSVIPSASNQIVLNSGDYTRPILTVISCNVSFPPQAIEENLSTITTNTPPRNNAYC